MAKNKKHIITIEDQLKMHNKLNRETMHKVKPMVSTDKKKEKNKKSCRKKIDW